jgi:hypothetical protein
MTDKSKPKKKRRPQTEETKRKISEANKGKQHPFHRLSEEHKRKIGIAGKGRIVSPETRQKLSDAHKRGCFPSFHHTEETKRKIGIASKGHTLSKEIREQISKSNKGKKRSPETKERISFSQKGKLFSPETRLKISHAIKLKNQSPEYKEHLKIGHQGLKATPKTLEKLSVYRKEWMQTKGGKAKLDYARSCRKFDEETRKKQSLSHIGKKLSEETKYKLSQSIKGDKSHFWRGGISFDPYTPDWNENLKMQIRLRDNYICQLCSRDTQALHIRHSVHHINYDKTDSHWMNLIFLCNSCHTRTNSNREHWHDYFTNLMINRFNPNRII